MKRHRYDLGIVGNCAYLGYIDTSANVKWLCMPRFDSSFLFGSLLDEQKGGNFWVRPAAPGYKCKQYYLPNTNILCTEFNAADGRFRVIDFAPRMTVHNRQFRPLMLVRKIELLSGSPAVQVVCDPRGNYGAQVPEKVTGSNHIRYLNLDRQVRLTTDVSLNYILEERSFVLDSNRYLVLTYGEPLEAPLMETAEEFLAQTTRYWQGWVKACYVPNLHQDAVIRSALILKLHQYEDTGGIIASGTTSLPEFDGSGRNWDYRFCWFRDTYYTLLAFNQLGHFEELEKYFEFVQNIIRNASGTLQPLYSITGDAALEELELPLSGYRHNRPVRIGNKAYLQVQNDVYGQVLVSLLPLYIDKRLTFAKKHSYHQIVPWLVSGIERTMDAEDAGLWEFRNSTFVFAYTMLFHWAGTKAAYKMAEAFGDAAMMQKTAALNARAAANLEKCWDPARGCYTQAIGLSNLDASTLKLITMNYLSPQDPKATSHLNELYRELAAGEGLFYRYKHADDFGAPETTFLVCAFWYIDALACMNRTTEAMDMLSKVQHFSNHLGIFSEDVALDGSQWGNFPQTYSHVGLINAAFRIAKKLDLPDYL